MKQSHFEILLEDINGKFDFLVEAFESMKPKVDRIPHIEARLDTIENDVRIIKNVLLDHTSDIQGLKQIHPGMSHNAA